MDYAFRVLQQGWEIAFLNLFCCEHIGRLTSELPGKEDTSKSQKHKTKKMHMN